MAFVLDASTTMPWCFVDEATPYTEAVLDRLRIEGALVPAVWPLEVANTLLVGERRRRISPAAIAAFTQLVQTLPIEMDEASGLAAVLGPIRSLAWEQTLSSYDASYVELALRRSLALATVDARMRAAAARLRVPLVGEATDGAGAEMPNSG